MGKATKVSRGCRTDGLVRVILAIAALALQGCLGGGHDQPPIAVAPHVDLDRVYGGWFIVATIPNWFEKGLVAPYDVYSRREDGDIREDFSVRKGGFAAPVQHFTVHDWAKPGTGNARWRVQIFWPLALPFLVLYVDSEYRFILFGEENRSLGWIFSRTAVVDDATYQALLREFQVRGYDITKFRRWVQFPEQIGQPGFWSDGIAPAGGG
jgi:apolipoprotein D and lipocalin family protein